MYSKTVPSMHRISTRCKRFAFLTTVRRVAGILAIHHVGGDGEHRLGVHRLPIGRILPQLRHKRADHPGSQLIDSIVVVSKLWEIPGYLKVSDQTSFVTNRAHARVTNCRKAVRNDR